MQYSNAEHWILRCAHLCFPCHHQWTRKKNISTWKFVFLHHLCLCHIFNSLFAVPFFKIAYCNGVLIGYSWRIASRKGTKSPSPEELGESKLSQGPWLSSEMVKRTKTSVRFGLRTSRSIKAANLATLHQYKGPSQPSQDLEWLSENQNAMPDVRRGHH